MGWLATLRHRNRQLRTSIASRMNDQTTKGAKKHPALRKSARLQITSLAVFVKYAEPQSNTVVARERAPKTRREMLPICFFWEISSSVDNGSPK